MGIVLVVVQRVRLLMLFTDELCGRTIDHLQENNGQPRSQCRCQGEGVMLSKQGVTIEDYTYKTSDLGTS